MRELGRYNIYLLHYKIQSGCHKREKKLVQLLPVLSQSVIYYKENNWEIEGTAKGKKN